MIIDGKKIAEELRDKIKSDIKKLPNNNKPGLNSYFNWRTSSKSNIRKKQRKVC